MNRTVSLQTPGCIVSGIIMHELLHTLGKLLSFLEFFSHLSIELVSFMNNHDLIVILMFKSIQQTFYQIRSNLRVRLNNRFLWSCVDLLSQFTKYSSTTSNTQNISYDYHSVMHYGTDAFTANGSPTIVPRQANVKIGQRYFLSSSDIAAIRKFYSYSGVGTTLPTPTTTTPTRKCLLFNH